MYPVVNKKSSHSILFSRIAAIIVTIVGLLVLLGWTLNIHGFKTIYGNITMKANAAVAMLLAGSSLLSLTWYRHKPIRMFGIACAALVALIGAMTLSQHLIGWNLGIDQLLFHEELGATATTSPGRMGPPASTSFALSGFALLLLFADRSVPVAQALGLVILFLSLLPLLGYAYQAEQLYGIARFSGIALHTAITLLILALGILSVRIRSGLTAVIASNNIAGAMARRLIIPAIIVPFLLGWLHLIGQQAQIYDLGFATAILVAAIISFFAVAIWRTARILAGLERQQTKAERALRASEERLNVAIKHAPLIIFNHDTELRYTWIHKPLFGLNVHDMLGKRDDQLIKEPDARLMMSIKRQVIESGVSVRKEVTLQNNGVPVHYDLSIEPLRNEAGKIIGATCAAVDITALKEVESQLRKANQMKDEFLATISHELRTPLNSILGWAMMLRRRQLEETVQKRALEIIERSARIQAQLIEDLLDTARIISGKLRLETEPVDLNSVLQSAVDSIRHSAEAKQIDLQMVLDPLPCQTLGDVIRLQQVYWNILSNAVKFTPVGGTIRLYSERMDSKVRITVTDTGEGISNEFLPYVFDRFQQADGTTTRRHGGLGLGLAIARHIIEMHGGTIAVYSEGSGKGTTLQTDLMLLPAAFQEKVPPLARLDVSTPPVETLKGLNVLIVDDEQDAREMLKTLLTRYGANTVLCGSAQEAFDILRNSKPDLLLCDIGMPEEDGYSLIRRIRKLHQKSHKEIPAIALTGYVRVEERVHALDEGFQMFVAKPVEPDELISGILHLTTRK